MSSVRTNHNNQTLQSLSATSFPKCIINSAINNTIDNISESKVKILLQEVMEDIDKKIKQYNEDVECPIITQATLLDALKEINSIISATEKKINDMAPSSDSKRKVQIVLGHVQTTLKTTQDQLSSPISTPDEPDWKKHRLHFEQELLLPNAKLGGSFNKFLQEIEKKGRNYTIPNRIFICYAWPDEKTEKYLSWLQPFLVGLRDHLRSAGLIALLDIKDCSSGANIFLHMTQAESSDFVILVGTESLLRKHMAGTASVCAELISIKRKRIQDKQDFHVIPILVSGDFTTSFPAQYELYTNIIDWKNTSTYFLNLCRLIEKLYSTSSAAFNDILDNFIKSISDEEQAILTKGITAEAISTKFLADQQEQKESEQKRTESSLKLFSCTQKENTQAPLSKISFLSSSSSEMKNDSSKNANPSISSTRDSSDFINNSHKNIPPIRIKNWLFYLGYHMQAIDYIFNLFQAALQKKNEKDFLDTVKERLQLEIESCKPFCLNLGGEWSNVDIDLLSNDQFRFYIDKLKKYVNATVTNYIEKKGFAQLGVECFNYEKSCTPEERVPAKDKLYNALKELGVDEKKIQEIFIKFNKLNHDNHKNFREIILDTAIQQEDQKNNPTPSSCIIT
jgi:hypothetical protein